MCGRGNQNEVAPTFSRINVSARRVHVPQSLALDLPDSFAPRQEEPLPDRLMHLQTAGGARLSSSTRGPPPLPTRARSASASRTSTCPSSTRDPMGTWRPRCATARRRAASATGRRSSFRSIASTTATLARQITWHSAFTTCCSTIRHAMADTEMMESTCGIRDSRWPLPGLEGHKHW